MGLIPFQERKTPLRGILDLLTGAYPGFLFGRRLCNDLPVFHFHDVRRDELDPYFSYLADGGYETVTSETVGLVADGAITPAGKMVALCFDDAWASLWSVVLPLLKKYGLKAITYVAPGRIAEAESCRTVASGVDAECPVGSAFATWPELIALHASGHVDVQAHTQSHAMVFCAPDIVDFVNPQTDLPLLSWPQSATAPHTRFLSASELGYPLFPQRARMSDARRYIVDPDVPLRCCSHVAEHGGAPFFDQPGWQQALRNVAQPLRGRFETDAERDADILGELIHCRDVLETRLSKPIKHICMPWAICGQRAEALVREAGYESMVADSLFGRRVVHAGSNRYRLMRLKHQYIFSLPGVGRRTVWSLGGGRHHD